MVISGIGAAGESICHKITILALVVVIVLTILASLPFIVP
jgi:hypothetical protein